MLGTEYTGRLKSSGIFIFSLRLIFGPEIPIYKAIERRNLSHINSNKKQFTKSKFIKNK